MGEGPTTAGGSRKPRSRVRYYTAIAAAAVTAAGIGVGASVAGASASPVGINSLAVPATSAPSSWLFAPATRTPIKHLVVIFDENESFDHYFGTYPYATNQNGSPFHAKPGTPTVNGLYASITPSGPVGPLLTDNPNDGYNPERLSPSQALTCSQNHNYQPEQEAVDGGKMDMFVQDTQHDTCTGQPIVYGAPGLVLDYYDGNTVTALWNYAQNYAMSDNNFDTDFGPSSPGALNLISGNDGGGYAVSSTAADPTTAAHVTDPGSVAYAGGNTANLGTIFGDIDPAYDDCSDTNHTSTSPVGVMTGQNIGNLLNARNVSWGWFQGGFAPTGTADGYEVCGSEHENIGGIEETDYVPHHDPFQFYASTSNPKHLPPTSEAAIGHTDQANHQYDLSDFYETLKDGNMPSVSFLKPPAYENAHPGNSDPLDEQTFVVNTINQIEESRYWPSTAIIITYDDSDGWYDHVSPPIVNGSNDPSEDESICTSVPTTLGTAQDRCGFGPRLPLLVISPWTRDNYVSNNLTDTASIIRFIEDNWLGGQRLGNGSYDAISGSLDAPGGVLDFDTFPHFQPVILNPTTGEVVSNSPF
ncbi:MAG TPA: alkaline phosphatase family protein [Streptosporangiaceae bacterium]|nr:alkaline phosphatase family protein [Streptosporangiaceae bacterium]